MLDVAVITPAVDAGVVVADVNTTAFGVLKFTLLKMLNSSARNCSVTRSVMAVFFVAEKSIVRNPGPISVSRPTFP